MQQPSKPKFIEPRLKDVRTLSAFAIKLFGVLNIVLGVSLFFQTARASKSLFIVNQLLDYQVWGIIFFAVGLVLSISYLFNLWRVMRYSLIASLGIELYWALALILRQLFDPGENIILAILFATLAVVQIMSYLQFPTYEKYHDKRL